MAKEFCVIQVTEMEKRIILKGLVDLKEKQKSENKEYAFLDDLIVRICDAPMKGKKLFHEER